MGDRDVRIDRQRKDESRGIREVLAGSGLDGSSSRSARKLGFDRDRPRLPVRNRRSCPEVSPRRQADLSTQKPRDLGAHVLGRRAIRGRLPGPCECLCLIGAGWQSAAQHGQTQHCGVPDVQRQRPHARNTTPGWPKVRNGRIRLRQSRQHVGRDLRDVASAEHQQKIAGL